MVTKSLLLKSGIVNSVMSKTQQNHRDKDTHHANFVSTRLCTSALAAGQNWSKRVLRSKAVSHLPVEGDVNAKFVRHCYNEHLSGSNIASKYPALPCYKSPIWRRSGIITDSLGQERQGVGYLGLEDRVFKVDCLQQTAEYTVFEDERVTTHIPHHRPFPWKKSPQPG